MARSVETAQTGQARRHPWHRRGFRPSPTVVGLLCILTLGTLPAHGIFEKVLWNDKANAATRGNAGSKATTLYMMQPKHFVTGTHQTVGWRITLQDEDASTSEPVGLHFVPYAPDGKSPEIDPKKRITSLQLNLFGRGMTGTQAMSWLITFGFPKPLPRNHGLAVELPANSLWPKDGLSVHGQLNLPQDSRRPRIPAPHDKQVWAFEQPSGATTATPLGGRTLDSLMFGGLYIEPTLRPFLESKAYGLGTEKLYGVDVMHPVASRGDRLGFFIDGGIFGTSEWGLVLISPKILANEIPFPRGYLQIDPTAPFPVVLLAQKLDSLGQATTMSIPFSSFPAGLRTFWAQAAIVQVTNVDMELSDAVGFSGL